jgi:hypothetical protein
MTSTQTGPQAQTLTATQRAILSLTTADFLNAPWEHGPRYIEQTLGSVSEATRRANVLIEELCQIAQDDLDRNNENAQAFLGAATNARTVEIGQELDAIGGEALMVAACAAVMQRHGVIYRCLEAAWDDIGSFEF